MIMTWRERLKEYLSKYGDAPSDATAQAMQAEIDELRAALAAARRDERERIRQWCHDQGWIQIAERIRNLTDE